MIFFVSNLNNAPMQKNKIDRTKVLAALNTICPSCGFSISPSEIVRVDSQRMRCPKCGHVFEAGKPPSGKDTGERKTYCDF